MHRRTSAISEETIKLMLAAQQELAKNWEGMVVAGSGPNFCVGADIGDILGAAADKKWDLIDKALLRTQTAYDANKYSEKPVVMAVHGRALGGGCEMVIQSSAIQAAGESYMGLVEVGVGLIPAGGGIKEAVLKTLRRMEGTKAHPVDVIQSYFENIAMAKVSTSAKEAVKLDYMRPTDGVSLNQDYLISDAKKRALSMIEAGYTAPVKKPFPAFGQNALALLKVGTKQMLQAGLISEYDWHIACRIVDVMAGGSVIAGAMITEEYLEALEREVFISLCGQQKTIDRIMHVLKTGKPLRN
jgi:3-hydroxyacyl-CoA dehydrogenase